METSKHADNIQFRFRVNQSQTTRVCIQSWHYTVQSVRGNIFDIYNYVMPILRTN